MVRRCNPTGTILVAGGRGLVAHIALLLSALLPAAAQTPAAKLAVVSSLSGGFESSYGQSFLDGVRLAVEEANAIAGGPPIVLDILDDRSNEDGAREAASRIAGSDALAVVGPPLSTSSLAAGPIFAQAGIVSIVSTAESDRITDNGTSFRTIFKNSDLGGSLADYLRYALNGQRAAVIFADNGYGQTLADGFRRSANRLGLATTFHAYRTAAERNEAVHRVAADPNKPAIVLGMLDADAVPAVVALRRAGVVAPILGPTALGDQAFADKFKDMPEERQARGAFTRNVYAAVPIILDSANAPTLAFTERFRARFGNDHAVSWISVQSYDAARLAIAAIRATATGKAGGDPRARREAIRSWLLSLDSPAKAMAGLAGPLWFTPDRGRTMPIRVGRFNSGMFESAPLQLVPVARPSEAEIAAGTVVEIGDGQYARRQQVVYTGIFLNELPRLDLAQSTFTADFYVWVRFSRGIATADADPTQLVFPELVRGSFDARQLAAQRDLDDGTTYRLWRLRGDFKNDFDLHRYPADHQMLTISFFNARAASDRLVYVLDRGSLGSTVPMGRDDDDNASAGGAAPTAFRNLTQWRPVHVVQARENLVAESGLGDPGLVGAEREREWSGFAMTVEVQRLLGTTLTKTLLPIGLMTLILFATLFLPSGLAAPKVSVAITAGLAGAVLLAAINAQLGNVGYVIAVEYGFYVFFALCLLCITIVVVGEQRRVSGKSTAVVDWVGRALFIIGFAGAIMAAWIAVAEWK